VRVFALSDVHFDFEVNARWVDELSNLDYRDDALILAGDVTHKLSQLASCLRALVARFRKVLFVPGNHDLWVLGEGPNKTSLQKFAEVATTVELSGASMQPFQTERVLIAPLFGWYDYSFGQPTEKLREIWMDYHACRWPVGFGAEEVANHFAALNRQRAPGAAVKVITFSHFMPRLDLIPAFVPSKHRLLDPVLGSSRLEGSLRGLNSTLHVYGHSHINRRVCIDGVTYVNNALGYPGEAGMTARKLLCVAEI
jgi:predicted phosphodiesterase